MPSGQEYLGETTANCKEIADGLGADEHASQAWEDSLTEIVEKLEEVSGSFFFKTLPSIPVTRTCSRESTALLEMRRNGKWDEFAPALEQLIRSAQDLIDKAGMRGTTLT